MLPARGRRSRSKRVDVGRLLAFRAVHDLELDRLALVQGLEALALDRGEVDEHVLPGLARDEPVALLVAEPLHGALLCQRTPPGAWARGSVARATVPGNGNAT